MVAKTSRERLSTYIANESVTDRDVDAGGVLGCSEIYQRVLDMAVNLTTTGTIPTSFPIEQALIRYKNGISKIKSKKTRERLHSALTGVSNIADIQNTFSNSLSKRQRGKAEHFLQRLNPFMTGLERYGRAIDSLVQGLPKPTMLVWGCFRVLMEIIISNAQITPTLERTLIKIGDHLPRSDLLLSTFEYLSTGLANSLIQIYEAVLQFFVGAIVFMHRKAFVRFVRNVFQPQAAIYEKQLAHIRDASILVDSEAAAWSIKLQEDRHKARLHKEITLWLAPFEHVVWLKRFEDNILPNSGAWLRKNPIFVDWIDNQLSGCLWLKGKAGSGKSYLACTVIRNLQNRPDRRPTLYFYFDSKSDKQRTADCLARSFLVQLLSSCAERQLQQDFTCLTNLYEASLSKEAKDFSTLWAVFLRIIDSMSNVCCVIDGVDECIDCVESQLLPRILDLSTKIQVFLTSQEDHTINRILDGKTFGTLTLREQNFPDIEKYIRRERSKMDKVQQPSQREKLESLFVDLPSRAEGTFLWVKLLLKELELQPTLEGIISTLHKPLCSLAGLVDGIISSLYSKLESVEKDYTKRIMQILLAALRPLKLKELAEMLAVDIESKKVDEARRLQSHDIIRKYCGPIIEMVGDEIHFTHSSVHEYLVKGNLVSQLPDEIKRIFFVDLHDAHKGNALICLTYLSSVPPLFPGSHEDTVYEYAAISWYLHVVQSGDPTNDILQKVASFLNSEWSYPMFTWIADTRSLVGHFGGHVLLLQRKLERWVYSHDIQPEVTQTISHGVERICERGLAAQESNNTPLEQRLSSLKNLAEIYESHERLVDAETTLRKAINLCINKFGEDSLEVYRYMFLIYRPISNQGRRLKETEGILEATYKGYSKHLGENALETLAVGRIWGTILGYLGIYDKAEQLQMRTFTEREKILGPEHPETLRSICSIAYLHWSTGDLVKSKSWQTKLFEGRNRVLGPQNPDTLSALRGLAFICAGLDETDEAKMLHERAAHGWQAVMNSEYDMSLEGTKMLAPAFGNPWSLGSKQGWAQEADCKCEHWLGGRSCWGGSISA